MAGRGNPNPKGPKADKLIRDALKLALNRQGMDKHGKKDRKLSIAANAIVDQACDGNVEAMKFIAERVDGKVPQAVTGDDGGPLTIVLKQFVVDEPSAD